jgi:transcriptional regulator NrdR family protein
MPTTRHSIRCPWCHELTSVYDTRSLTDQTITRRRVCPSNHRINTRENIVDDVRRYNHDEFRKVE